MDYGYSKEHADRVRKIREDQKFTQTQFGRKLGVSRGKIVNVELLRTPLKKEFASHIIERFNIRKEWFDEGTGAMYRSQSDSKLWEEALKDNKLAKDKLIKELFEMIVQLDKKELHAVECIVKCLSGNKDLLEIAEKKKA